MQEMPFHTVGRAHKNVPSYETKSIVGLHENFHYFTYTYSGGICTLRNCPSKIQFATFHANIVVKRFIFVDKNIVFTFSECRRDDFTPLIVRLFLCARRISGYMCMPMCNFERSLTPLIVKNVFRVKHIS